MANFIDIKAEKRAPGRKGPSIRLRASGNLPATMYGHGEPVTISVSTREFEHMLATSRDAARTLLKISLDGGEPDAVMIKHIDRHPVTNAIVHLDFYRVRMDEPIQMSVPIRLIGTPRGVKAGGKMLVLARRALLSCLPGDMPHDLPVDISGLRMGSTLLLKEVQLPEGVEYVTDPEEAVVVVQAPRGGKDAAEEEAETAEGEEPAEPELIGKGKEDGGEEEG